VRILVTRPQALGELLASQLRNRGHEVVVGPVIEIAPTGRTPVAGRADAVLATSANAFDATLAGPEFAALRRAPIFVVGARTAAAAVRCGFPAPTLTAPDARSLLAGLSGLQPAPQRFLYLAGVHRKRDLEAGLRAMGRQVGVCEVYEARGAGCLATVAQDALRNGEIDAVVHFSRRSAALFCDLAQKAGLTVQARALLHLCISEDAACGLDRLEPADVRVAGRPDLAGMMALLSAD